MLVRVLLFLLALNKVSCKNYYNKEAEDFFKFLEETAEPEPPLLDDHPESADDGTDPSQDEPIKDAWIYSGKFEGDLILNKRQRRVIAEDVAEDDGQLQAIEDGMENIASSSCIKFRPYQKGDQDAVVIQGARRGCFSAVGYQSGYQVLNLSGRHPVGRGCFRHGTVVHELLHTLGFFHMQSSPDRDDYISVLWDNIIEGAKHNFRKYNQFSVTDFGVPYDYDSVLHYSTKAFSKNGEKTIVPKESGVRIGQRRGMSDADIEKLNKMYCSESNDVGQTTQNATEDTEDTTVSVESTTPKITKRKKKAKGGKPFKGSGLGYAQGRSLIIQFPEQYELAETEGSANPNDEFEIVKKVKNSNAKKNTDKKPKTDTDKKDKIPNEPTDAPKKIKPVDFFEFGLADFFRHDPYIYDSDHSGYEFYKFPKPHESDFKPKEYFDSFKKYNDDDDDDEYHSQETQSSDHHFDYYKVPAHFIDPHYIRDYWESR